MLLAACWYAYLGTAALLALYALHRLHLSLAAWRARPPAPPPPVAAGEEPIVTVQLPLYNEICVAGRLLDAVAALDWPRDRLEIQILDDSTDETAALCAARAAALRAAGFDAHHLHRADRTGYKAGALAAGLARSRGELLLILDADFTPPPDLLRRVAGHFREAAVGLVQARWEHLNREDSLLTRVQALLLDGHFAVEQTARAARGRFFNFNGTAGVWRRAAVESAGGWHADTLTEDLDLSYRALLAGWRFVYRGDVAAAAELPADVHAFRSQQFRWAKGSAQVARKLLPRLLAAPLPLGTKVEALFHLTQNVPYLLALLLALLLVPAQLAGRLGPTGHLALDLPLLAAPLAGFAAYFLVSQRALGRGVAAGLARVPAALAITAGICVSQARAVVEGLAGRASPFVRTPKQGSAVAGPPRYRSHAGAGGELLLASYLAAAAAVAALAGRWPLVAPLGLYAAGLWYVALAPLAARLAGRRKRNGRCAREEPSPVEMSSAASADGEKVYPLQLSRWAPRR